MHGVRDKIDAWDAIKCNLRNKRFKVNWGAIVAGHRDEDWIQLQILQGHAASISQQAVFDNNSWALFWNRKHAEVSILGQMIVVVSPVPCVFLSSFLTHTSVI